MNIIKQVVEKRDYILAANLNKMIGDYGSLKNKESKKYTDEPILSDIGNEVLRSVINIFDPSVVYGRGDEISIIINNDTIVSIKKLDSDLNYTLTDDINTDIVSEESEISELVSTIYSVLKFVKCKDNRVDILFNKIKQLDIYKNKKYLTDSVINDAIYVILKDYDTNITKLDN